jgi:hypothetical protein
MGVTDFSLRVVGERFDNEDGTSRQAEIEQMAVGDKVDLVREPDNPHDPSAVGVYSDRGIRIGFLGADRCGWVGSKISRGMDVRAAVERIGPAGQAGHRGVVIKVNLHGEDPVVGYD